jgi:hypothetical protein
MFRLLMINFIILISVVKILLLFRTNLSSLDYIELISTISSLLLKKLDYSQTNHKLVFLQLITTHLALQPAQIFRQ